ncbi:hypothetical protein LL946_07065 [Knoellia locipacati]|uniref:hypothetical protein n=1 Tax=Knoellia locipacati TaxID=882824 RepID=UPI0038504782
MALLAALPVLASLWKQAPCLDRGWGGQEPFWRYCYSDLAVSTQTAGADRGLVTWLAGDVPLDHPPLTGALLSLVAGAGPGGDALATQRWVLGLWAVLSVAALALMAWWVRDVDAGHDGVRRGLDPRHVVLAPVAALTLLLSPDLLGVALATGGLWAWSRRHPVLAGALLGAGLLARTYPGLLLLVVAAHAWRTGREHELGRVAVGALAAVAVVVVPLLVAEPALVTRSWGLWNDSLAGLGSVWYLPTLAGSAWSAGLLTVLAVLGVVLAVVLAGVLVLGAPTAPRIGAAALVLVAVVLVSGKSFPVQSSLWLVPLVALAGLRWRDHLVWALAEAVHFVAVWLYLGGLQDANRGLPASWYAVALLGRVAAVVYLAVRAWQTATAGPRGVWDPPPREGVEGTGAADSPTATTI